MKDFMKVTAKRENTGQPIRFEPEAKGRFEPISVDAWNEKYTTGIIELDAKYHKQ